MNAAAAFSSVTLRKIGKRYRPDLYIPRAADEELWNWLSQGNADRATALLLIEKAGSGKTNLACQLTERLLQDEIPCVVILGSDPIANRFGLIEDVLSGFGIRSGPRERLDGAIDELNLEIGNRHVCVVIDAINEARDVERMQDALQELFARFENARVRILITCRDIYWTFLKGPWVDVIDCQSRTLGLWRYDSDTWPLVRDRYFQAFGIRGSLAGTAEEKCRHPLLFRFFCEAYQDEEVTVITQIRLKPLFEKYLQKKVERIALERQRIFRADEGVETVLESIATEMLTIKEVSIPERSLAELTVEPDYRRRDSLYVRLLDEDIILDEVPDTTSERLARRVRFVYEAFFVDFF